jgi:hypothetical protein
VAGRYFYAVSNYEYFYGWLKANCSAEVGLDAINWVEMLCSNPRAMPPEGRPLVGSHPQTKVTIVRSSAEGLSGAVTRRTVAIEYLVIDEHTQPPIPDVELGTIDIVHLRVM